MPDTTEDRAESLRIYRQFVDDFKRGFKEATPRYRVIIASDDAGYPQTPKPQWFENFNDAQASVWNLGLYVGPRRTDLSRFNSVHHDVIQLRGGSFAIVGKIEVDPETDEII